MWLAAGLLWGPSKDKRTKHKVNMLLLCFTCVPRFVYIDLRLPGGTVLHNLPKDPICPVLSFVGWMCLDMRDREKKPCFWQLAGICHRQHQVPQVPKRLTSIPSRLYRLCWQGISLISLKRPLKPNRFSRVTTPVLTKPCCCKDLWSLKAEVVYSWWRIPMYGVNTFAFGKMQLVCILFLLVSDRSPIPAAASKCAGISLHWWMIVVWHCFDSST